MESSTIIAEKKSHHDNFMYLFTSPTCCKDHRNLHSEVGEEKIKNIRGMRGTLINAETISHHELFHVSFPNC